MKNFIAASLIAANFWNLEKEFKRLKESKVRWIHYDIMDGHYVPNITIGSCELDSLVKKSSIPIDIKQYSINFLTVTVFPEEIT